jgi:type II secretory pathway component PulJ
MKLRLPEKYTSHAAFRVAHMQRGFTLIEAIIYIALMSLLIINMIHFDYDIHAQNLNLNASIQAALASSTIQ